ncbi:hypothetical protein BJ170DRAFT_734039 [Xylariales sp. AK1849]|nr:hypothetical protein BJ170DRAFT_734039 [Xylariales sp. AK1849]
MVGPQTRKRAALNCIACRKRKIGCDRKHPCGNCQRLHKTCTYDSAASSSDSQSKASADSGSVVHSLQPGNRETRGAPCDPVPPGEPESVSQTLATPVPTAGTWYCSQICSLLVGGGGQDEPAHLLDTSIHTPVDPEQRVPRPLPIRADRRTQTPSVSNVTDLFPPVGGITQPMRGAFFKGRYVGQSHWMYSWALLPSAVIIVDEEMRKAEECWNTFQECKSLQRLIKSQRRPLPRPYHEYGRHWPSRLVADQLIDAYLRTFETAYRIFHVPSLKLEYERLWEADPSLASPGLLIQIQLCMCIGACFYDEQCSLRSQATQWIHEAYSWLSHSSAKSKITMGGLQTMCLLHIARQTAGIEGDFVWISSGSLLRTAISMGFHVDPARLPTMPALQAEMRRRLWATITELLLESSMDAGNPPLVPLDKFSPDLPSNLNDSQFVDLGITESPTPLPYTTRTDSAVQIAFARSFGVRLAIAKATNNYGCWGSYQDTLRLGADLTAACHELRSQLQALYPEDGGERFQVQFCDLMIHRYFLPLHLPYIPMAMASPVYSFSQKACIETALRLFYGGLTTASAAFKNSALSGLQKMGSLAESHNDYSRLLRCGSGPFRSILMQCFMIIASELLSCIRDHTPGASGVALPMAALHPSGGTLRTLELGVMMRVGVEWTEQRIRAGETNVKDHCYVALALAIAEMGPASKSRGADEAVRKQYCDAFKHCAELLSRIAFPDTAERNVDAAVGTEFLDLDSFWMSDMSDFEWDGSVNQSLG